jgi:hypothetical protein
MKIREQLSNLLPFDFDLIELNYLAEYNAAYEQMPDLVDLNLFVEFDLLDYAYSNNFDYFANYGETEIDFDDVDYENLNLNHIGLDSMIVASN